MSTAAETSVVPQRTVATPNWEQIGNGVVLLLYSAVALFTVRYHEKWADEAQAWLIARDLDLKTMWFHELRYEGSPGLWHTILWIAQHWFHLPYASLGYIGVAFAIAGVAVLVYKAPFPWYVRWPLAFTYVMVYQYAVIARPYNLLPLLCFLVAIFFKDIKHPVRMTVVLVLLANLTLHGTLLAACFGLLYLMEAIKVWPALDENVRNHYFICAAVMVFTFLLIFIILKPTPDIEEFALKNEFAHLSEQARQQMNLATPWRKFTTITSGAFLDYFAPSALFLVLCGAWFYFRRRLFIFVLPVGVMLAVYAVIHGAAHHHGTAFVAAITAFWIAWPSRKGNADSAPRETWITRTGVGLLVCLCVVNIWDAAVVIKREYLFPYSGAEDAANYLKSVGADRGHIFGLLYGVVAVQAYFDHKIFDNLPTGYFHHGLPLTGTTLDVEELETIQPEYVVVYTQEPQLMVETGLPQLTRRGYEVVHFSDGYYLYKQAVFEREVYFILRRVHPGDGQTPLPANPDK
jgi:hypothetical protein